MTKRIPVCCGTPLIITFMFSGSEWFCRTCKQDIPWMNANGVEETPELLRERDDNKAWFAEIAKDCVPRGARLRDCDQCVSQDHLEHATEEELERSRIAYARLLER